MQTKYFTKRRLIAVNEQARKAGGNHIDPDFLQTVPANFKYPVCRALPMPMDKGWYRYWVTVGTSCPVVSDEDLHNLMLDMPAEIFENLPTMAVDMADEGQEVGR